MPRSSYLFRMGLYFLIAVLGTGSQYLFGNWKAGAATLLAGIVAVRCFIDKSGTELSGAQVAELLALLKAANAPKVGAPPAEKEIGDASTTAPDAAA